MSEVGLLQVQDAQRKGAKRATWDAMRAKKRKRLEFETKLGDEDVSFLFVALRPSRFDELVSQYPATEEQRAKAAAAGERTDINEDTFPPALLAEVCREPRLSVEQWDELFHPKDEDEDTGWSRGELGTLYWQAYNLCNAPLDVGPFGRASAATRPTTSSSDTATSTESPTADS